MGRPVYPQANTGHDVCGWYLNPPGTGFTVPEVTVTTGYTANVQTRTRKTAALSAGWGLASIAVPQFNHVPGSPVPPSKVTQPMVITYRYPTAALPTNVSPGAASRVRKGEAVQASKTVTALADDLAQNLPQGPGASDVTMHLFD